MYKAKYVCKTELDVKGKKLIDYLLNANFNFWKETAPKDRRIIRERMKDFFRKVKEKEKKGTINPVPDEFLYEDGKHICSSVERRLYNRISLKFSIQMFDIHSFCKHYKSPGKIIDLDGINEYILTGKNKKD